MSDTPTKAPPCLKCAHFYVTGDARFPRACRVFGIKTAGIPSTEVFLATRRHCPSYQENPKLLKS